MFYLVLMVLGHIFAVGDPGFATEKECEVAAIHERANIGELFARGIIKRGPNGEDITPADVSIQCMLDTTGSQNI